MGNGPPSCCSCHSPSADRLTPLPLPLLLPPSCRWYSDLPCCQQRWWQVEEPWRWQPMLQVLPE